MDGDEDDIWYPTVDDVLSFHRDIIKDDPDSTMGVQDEERVEFAIGYIKGNFGEVPRTIHEKAFHLMRLIASNHWFADGNKRTALNATELFYLINNYDLVYGDDIRSMLKLISIQEKLIDKEAGPEYLRDRAKFDEFDSNSVETETHINAFILLTIENNSDFDAEYEFYGSDIGPQSLRKKFGLTTEYDTTVDSEEDARDILRRLARNRREENRDVYDALAEE